MTSAHSLNMAASRILNLQRKIGDYVLFKNLDGKYLTLKDCIEENKKETEEPENQAEEKKEDTASEENKDAQEKEPEKTVIFYVTDEVQQSQYINMFKRQERCCYPETQH